MAQIIQSFVAQINQNIDPAFVVQNQNILSQIIVILSQELSNLFDTLQVGFDVLDPNSASGNDLIDAAQYVGVKPLQAMPTIVYLLLLSDSPTVFPINTTLSAGGYTIENLDAGYEIVNITCSQATVQVLSAIENTNYQVQVEGELVSYTATPDDTIASIATKIAALINGIAPTYPLIASVNSTDTSKVTINIGSEGKIIYNQLFAVSADGVYVKVSQIGVYGKFTNSVTGNISIPAGTFNLSSTPIAGVSTQQPENSINGNDADTDETLRLRRQLSLAYGGNRTIAAIRSRLLGTTFVKKAKVYQNQLSTPLALSNSITLKPNSIYAVVLGGYAPDIANTIYNTMSEGIQTNGSEIQFVTDDENNVIIINFDYAQEVYISMQVNIVVDKNVLYKIDKNAQQNIANAVLDYIQNLNIGETMYILSIKGVASCAVEYGIKSVDVSYQVLPNGLPQTTDLLAQPNQIILFNAANLTVNLTST